MSGGAGGCGGHYSGAGAYGGRARHYDSLYGSGWQEAALKTLEQELKERGIEPKSGDDSLRVVPEPRLVGDRVALGMVLAVVLALGIMACWAWWEWLPPDAPIVQKK